mmetsp:Transcript_1272/g.1511  ORF Transcript_1272/g.1511 Transcript_1272/m.1511 type:complete len:212 (-) Transcript_1272:1858-2493(-)
MIDIIGHFFVLYPLFTFIKETDKFGMKTNLHRFSASLVILTLAALFTNIYLMDTSLVQRGPKEMNLYELLELQPGVELSENKIKKNYRRLALKYHPEKNREEDTTEIYMKLVKANEILKDSERRIMYDVYGQTDFSYEDRMKSMIEQRFKNQTEREQQFKSYKSTQGNMKVFGEVGPYYLTWLMLTIYRIDRSLSYNILLVLIGVVFVFEI